MITCPLPVPLRWEYRPDLGSQHELCVSLFLHPTIRTHTHGVEDVKVAWVWGVHFPHGKKWLQIQYDLTTPSYHPSAI